MIAENGAQTIREVLTPGKMTIFPQASVHTMMNLGCDNAQLVSALSSDDAGTQNLANSFFRYGYHPLDTFQEDITDAWQPSI